MNWKDFLPYVMLFLLAIVIIWACIIFGVMGCLYILMEVFNLGC